MKRSVKLTIGFLRVVSAAILPTSGAELVTIYCFTTAEMPEQHIAATIWVPPATP
jgi:hypothetical protein